MFCDKHWIRIILWSTVNWWNFFKIYVGYKWNLRIASLISDSFGWLLRISNQRYFSWKILLFLDRSILLRENFSDIIQSRYFHDEWSSWTFDDDQCKSSIDNVSLWKLIRINRFFRILFPWVGSFFIWSRLHITSEKGISSSAKL